MTEVKDVWNIDFPFPKQKEVFDFCNYFSDNNAILSEGEYFNDSKTLHLKFVSEIKDSGTIVRYNLISKYVEVDFKIRTLPKDQQMILLCWGFCSPYARNRTFECDLITIEMLRLNGMSLKQLALGFIGAMSTIAPELDMTQKRVKEITEYLNEHNENQKQTKQP